MKIKKRKLEYFVDRLANNEPVTFARYGDGEVRTILQGKYKNQKNSNGCTFSPELAAALRLTLINKEPYDYGILRIALRNHRQEFGNYLASIGVDIDWIDGDVLLNENLAGNLFPLVEQIRRYKVVLVGQRFLWQLKNLDFFSPVYHVLPPKINAIKMRKQIFRHVMRGIREFDGNLILWSCGLHSKFFIHDVYRNTGGEISQIDCGSMWDGYCTQEDGQRVQSRSYIRRGRVLWDDLTEVNTGKREKMQGENFRHESE